MRQDHTHFPEGRQDAPTVEAGVRDAPSQQSSEARPETGRSVVPGR